MKLNIKAFFKGFLITTTSLFLVHLLIFRVVKLGIEPSMLLEIYAALIIISSLHFFTIRWLFQKWFKFAGFIFTALSFLKMGVSLLYLLPYIYPSNSSSIPIALNFMAVYFVMLFFEVYYISKNLLKKQEINS